MTKVLAGLVAGLFGLLTAMAPATAQAAKRRVGVSLTGASAGTIDEAIKVALRHHGFEVVRAELGGDSDDALAAAAKQAHLAAVMVGEVRDGGKRLKLRVYGAAGDLIGEGSWAEGGGPRRLGAAVERTLWARVGGALSKTHALGEKADKSEQAEPAEEAPADEKPTYAHAKDTDASADENEAPRKHRKKKAESSPEEESEGSAPAAGPALDFAVGPRFVSRDLSWTPAGSMLRGYTVGLAPSLGVNAAWYPAAHFRGGWPSNIGVGTAIEYTPGLVSRAPDGTLYATTASDYEADGRFRVLLGGAGQLAFVLGGGQHSFIFHSQGNASRANLMALPDVQYTYVRAGVDARFNLPANLSLMVAGGYRYVIDGGKDNYLVQSPIYLPNATFIAFDVSAGVGYRFLSLLEARAGADLRRYQITPGVQITGGANGVSGGTDQYTALWLRLAVLLDGVAAGEGGPAAAPHKAAPADEPPPGKGDDKAGDKDAKKGDDE